MRQWNGSLTVSLKSVIEGVRSDQILMLQIEAASPEWPAEVRPFLLEMARDLVAAAPNHSNSSLVEFAGQHCQDVLRERLR